MSYHDGSHTGFSIFFNKENFVFSLPLISLCTIYSFFRFIPLQLGVPFLGSIVFFYKITSTIKARAIERKEEKIASLDEDLLKELAADELLKKERQKQKEAKKQKKAGEKIRQRIAAEKRAKATFTETLEEEDDDVGDYTTFAKGGRASMVKKC